jgi:RimJ/RimL family protein N-acetyltransferase
MCGLLKRESLPDADIGFAFLPRFWRQGYGHESAVAVLEYGRRVHGLTRLLAVTSVDNHASIALLERLGLHYSGMVRLSDAGEEVRLMAREL